MISQYNATAARGSKPVKVSIGRQIIYRFNGDPKYDEVVSDNTGTIFRPRVGDVVVKKGKKWRVTVVRDGFDMFASRTAVPVHRIFLTDTF